MNIIHYGLLIRDLIGRSLHKSQSPEMITVLPYEQQLFWRTKIIISLPPPTPPTPSFVLAINFIENSNVFERLLQKEIPRKF